MTEEEYDLEVGACEQFISTVTAAVRKLSVTTEIPLDVLVCIQDDIDATIDNHIRDYMAKVNKTLPTKTEYDTYKEHLTR